LILINLTRVGVVVKMAYIIPNKMPEVIYGAAGSG
jgi:hypothetical protein